MHAIRKRIGARKDVLLWRNQTGQTKDNYGHYIRYGLGRGSSDLIGVLKPSGRFFGLEVKRPGGRVRPEQEMWIEMIRTYGAVGAIVDSVDDAERVVDEWQAEKT